MISYAKTTWIVVAIVFSCYGTVVRAQPDLFVLLGSDKILRYDGSDLSFRGTFASGMGLDAPRGIVIGPGSDFYVSSGDNDLVLRFDGVTGAYEGVFAQGGGLSGPNYLVFGPDGNLYVGSINTGTVIRYGGSTGAFIDVFATNAGYPQGIAFSPLDGDLYVADRLNRILRYSAVSGDLVTVVAQGGVLDNPRGITFGPDGDLFVSNAGPDDDSGDVIQKNEILRYDGVTGELEGVFASGGGLDLPKGLVFGPDGDLYVVSRSSDQVLQYDGVTGEFKRIFADQVGDAPQVAVFGPNGSMYVTSTRTDEVLHYDATGASLGVFATQLGLDSPIGIAFRHDGELFVSVPTHNQVLHYDGVTGTFMGGFLDGGVVDSPRALLFGPDGDLFVVSSETLQVLRYDGVTGGFKGVFAEGEDFKPMGMAIGNDGDLLVVDGISRTIFRYDFATGELMGTMANQVPVTDAVALVFGPDGRFFMNDFFTNSILQFDSLTGAYLGVFVQEPELNGPRGMAIGPGDGGLYVSSFYDGYLLGYDPLSGALVDLFGDGGEVERPVALTFAPTLVRGQSTGLHEIDQLRCNNRTTQEFVIAMPAPGETGWNCEAAGLTIESGDSVSVVLWGPAATGEGVGGVLTGMDIRRVDCKNLTTGDTASVALTEGDLSWDCNAAGLVASADDRIQISIIGLVR